ncbi:MAG: hypothetical protein ACFCD0_06730 [Gemmataceae bacterium]
MDKTTAPSTSNKVLGGPVHPDTRCLQTLKNFTAVALLFGFLFSPKLWLSTRSFPLVPVFDFLPTVPAPFDSIYLGILISLLFLIIYRKGSLALLVFLFMSGIWVVLDQMRLQPWFYQYWMMLALLAWPLSRPGNPQFERGGLNACRFVISSIYVWSGIQKLNHNFYVDVYPWLTEPLEQQLPVVLWKVVDAGAYYVPYLEMLIGLGLLLWPIRYIAVRAALAMHALLLYLLGPSNHDWNSIVWPWNIAMSAFVVLLFTRCRESPWSITWPNTFLPARGTLLMFGIMPAFSFLGLWDAYLSSALYSANTLRTEIRVSKQVYTSLPETAQEYVVFAYPDDEARPYEADITNWALTEMNVPPYPARRVYRRIARRLAQRGGNRDQVELFILERPDWRTGKRQRTREEF